MNIEEMKKKFESGKYVLVYRNNSRVKPIWIKTDFITNQPHLEFKLIHERHEDILNAYLEDNSVEIECIYPMGTSFSKRIDKDFIGNYDECFDYLLKTKQIDFLGKYYCRANKLTYGRLIQLGVADDFDYLRENEEWHYFIIESKIITDYLKEHQIDGELSDINIKQIKLNSNNEFEYVKEEDEHRDMSDIPKEDKTAKKISEQYDIENMMADKPLNNFEEYGFEADFEGEILFRGKCGYVYGRIKNKAYLWNKKGKCFKIEGWNNLITTKYDLTPIKKAWYEDESNFPCIIGYNCDGKKDRFSVVDSLVEFEDITCNKWLATEEEVMKLVIKE